MFPEIPEGLKWAAGTIVALLVAFGGSKVWDLVGDARKRRHFLEDKAADQHDTNQGKQIDANINAFNEMARRLERLESRFDKLQEAHTSLMAENAELKAENRHLRDQLTEVKKESESRRDRIRQLEGEVRKLQGEVAELIAIQRGEI